MKLRLGIFLAVAAVTLVGVGLYRPPAPEPEAPVAPPAPPAEAVESAPPPMAPPKAPAGQKKPTAKADDEVVSENRRQLRVLMEESYRNLPTFDDVESSGDVNHHLPPKALFRASSKLGKIRDGLAQAPEAVNEAARFYEDCARKEGVVLSLRALCLRNLMDLGPHLESSRRPVLDSYPDSIRGIAEKLPGKPFSLPRSGS